MGARKIRRITNNYFSIKMEQSTDKTLFPPIEKKDWERVLKIMNQYSRVNGYVDYDPNGWKI